MQRRFWQAAVVLTMLLPFVVFQGAPELTPAWLLAPRMRVPGTVWLAGCGYAGFGVLSWRLLHEADSGKDSR